MKKYLILAILAIISIIAYGDDKMEDPMKRERLLYGDDYIVAGYLNNIVGTGEVKVKPDRMTNTFEAFTENENLEKASEENAKNMNELKKYLISIGVKEDDIETTRYSRGEKQIPLPDTEQKKVYITTFQVLVTISSDNFYEFTNVTDAEGIGNIQKTATQEGPDVYYFTIVTQDTTKEGSKKAAKEKYDRIEASLKKIGATDVSLYTYNADEKIEKPTKKVYTITHDFTVKMSTDIDMGKLLKKCESLKIKNPGSLFYDISDELKKKSTLEAYNKAMADIYDKAGMMIKGREYTLGDFNVTDQTNQYQPYQEARNSKGLMMMNNMSLNGMKPQASIVAEDISDEDEIPFSVSNEMKITVSLMGNFAIIKKRK